MTVSNRSSNQTQFATFSINSHSQPYSQLYLCAFWCLDNLVTSKGSKIALSPEALNSKMFETPAFAIEDEVSTPLISHQEALLACRRPSLVLSKVLCQSVARQMCTLVVVFGKVRLKVRQHVCGIQMADSLQDTGDYGGPALEYAHRHKEIEAAEVVHCVLCEEPGEQVRIVVIECLSLSDGDVA